MTEQNRPTCTGARWQAGAYFFVATIFVTAGTRESWLQVTGLLASLYVVIWYSAHRRLTSEIPEWNLIYYCAGSFILYFLVHLIHLDQLSALPRLDGPSRVLIFAPLVALPFIAKASWNHFRRGITLSGLILAMTSLINIFWSNSEGRNFGFFTYHNLFGYSAMSILGILACTMSSKQRDVMAWLSMSCCLLTTIASGTRGALLALPIILMIATLKHRQILQQRPLITISTILLLISIMFIAFPLIELRVQTTLSEITQATVNNNYNTSIGQRLAMWKICWELILDRPLTGHGLSVFPDAMQPWADRLGLAVRFEYGGFQNPHNLYLGWAATMGIPSLLALLVLFAGIPIWIARQINRISPSLERQQAFMALVVLYILLGVFCLTESVIERQRGAAWFVIFICLIIGSMFTPSDQDRVPKAKNETPRS